jgi:hypothetical protein
VTRGSRTAAYGALLALAATAAAGAQGPEPDPGSSRVVAREAGFVARVSTARDGALRCIGVSRIGASTCSPPRLKEGALVIGHVVSRPRGRPPVLGRLVVAGLAGDAAVRVRVRWRGGARTIRPRRFGSYLAVLPASARQGDVVIAMRHRDGSSNVVDYRRGRERFRPVPGSARVEARLRDPLSRGRLGLLVWRAARRQTCTFVGDLVSGRVGFLRGRSFAEYPINDGGQCTTTAGLRTPLAFGATSGRGRVVVTGIAREDVARVELRLDDGSVSVLRLTRRRAFAHVLRAADPTLPGVTLTAVLRDGSRVEQRLGP